MDAEKQLQELKKLIKETIGTIEINEPRESIVIKLAKLLDATRT